MTADEFDSTGFHSCMHVEYEGEIKYVISVDFTERLFALVDERVDTPIDQWRWVRCENVSVRANLKVVGND